MFTTKRLLYNFIRRQKLYYYYKTLHKPPLGQCYNVGMNVYVEYVIADNLVLDTLLLWCAAVTLKLPVSKFRVFLGGVVGAFCAVASVWLNGVWLYLLKGACLLTMCTVAVGFGKKLFWYILLTVAYTFVAGGAIIGLFHLFNVDYLNGDGKFYQMDVPLFVYVLALCAVAFLCYSIAVYVKQIKKIAPHIVKITVKLQKNYRLTGFCDSGNTLTYDGVPVCFVTKKFDGFADYFAQQLLQRKCVNVPVSTVAGTVTVQAVQAEITAGDKQMNVYLALPAEKCQTMYNVLLSNEFCGG